MPRVQIKLSNMEYYDCEQEQWLPGVPPKAFLTTQQHISNASGSGDTPMINGKIMLT
jgi:hypothetical protein